MNGDFDEDEDPDFEPDEKPVEITGDDLDNLIHMLGVSGKHKNGYRNYFIAGGKDVDSMERLRAAGFVVRNEGYTQARCGHEWPGQGHQGWPNVCTLEAGHSGVHLNIDTLQFVAREELCCCKRHVLNGRLQQHNSSRATN